MTQRQTQNLGNALMTSEAPIATRWITAEQFASDRGFERGFYLLNGKAIRDMGNAHSEHEAFKAVIHALLLRLLDRLAINGRVFSDTSYEFDNLTVMAPDVSIQIPTRPFERGAFYRNSPEIAIEILSPSNSVHELDDKAKVYWTHGASAVWVFDPRERKAFVVTATGEWVPTELLEACGVQLRAQDVWEAVAAS
jgi:Uma2 family endonuclease